MANEVVNEAIAQVRSPEPQVRLLTIPRIWSRLDWLHSLGMLSLTAFGALAVSFAVINHKRPNDAAKILVNNAVPTVVILCLGALPAVLRGHVIPRAVENANRHLERELSRLMAELKISHEREGMLLQQVQQFRQRVQELNDQVIVLDKQLQQPSSIAPPTVIQRPASVNPVVALSRDEWDEQPEDDDEYPLSSSA